MAPPPFPRASIDLNYPPYAVEFDPEDANRLVVGGGGGANRSGVGNKISVIETASHDELRIAGDIELSRDEDSVMSLAIGAHKGKTTYLYAGVNSSPASILKGKNEHLRTLGIEQSKARASTGAKATEAKITELSRSTLFTDPEPDMYQRLLRVAGPLGVAATAMGKEPQLAVFETATGKGKGVMELPREAEDLDIVQTDDGFQIAFCYKYQLHIVNIGKDFGDPELVFSMPAEADEPRRPSFRAIRYLTPNFLFAVSNLPHRSGVLLQGLRLRTPGKDGAGVSCHARISRNISATGLAVANLSPPATPTTPIGDAQFLIAVAGNDSSVSLFTLEHMTGININVLHSLWPLHTLKEVHKTDGITGVAFSRFVTPKTHIRQQYIKLASISLNQSVVVHSIPLKKLVKKGTRDKRSPPRPVRYVTAMKAKGPSARPLVITLTVIVLIMAIIGQSIREMYGTSRPIIYSHKFLPSWHGTLRTPKHPPAALLAEEFLSKLSGDTVPQAGETLVVYEDAPSSTDVKGESEGEAKDEKKIQVEMHDPEQHGPGKTWEELPEKQKEAWKAKFKEAGAWTQHMGESVFQGILFGEMAGAVGRAVAG